MRITRHRSSAPAAALQARHREISAANHWAAVQPLSERRRTMETLEEWAARINEACSSGARVLRVGLTLQAPPTLRTR
jgi:hypothetical protein